MSSLNNSNVCPIIDFGDVTTLMSSSAWRNNKKLKIVADRVLQAFSETGFIYIINHGILDVDTETSIEVAKSFFGLSTYEKNLYQSKDSAKRGYSNYESDNFACLAGDIKPNDLVEKFRVGPIHIPSTNLREAKKYFFPNDLPKLFYPATPIYYCKLCSVTWKLLSILEISLGLPEGFFTNKMRKHTSIMTMNHYPHLSEDMAIQPGQLRIAEHTDVSMLTIVTQSPTFDGGGLEILLPSGEWHPVQYLPGSLIINIGDCLMEWTRGKLKSTKHRVSLPKLQKIPLDNSRFSIAFFVSPDFNAPLSWPSSEKDSLDRSLDNVIEKSSSSITYSQWRKKTISRAMKTLKS